MTAATELVSTTTSEIDLSPYLNLGTVTEHTILDAICLTPELREELEKDTRRQADSSKWHDSHRYCITGSKVGRVLQQHERTVALLQFCNYPKPMLNPLPRAISWGNRNEAKVYQAYMNHMHRHGHTGLEVTTSGFVVHLDKGWLGASPDGWVNNPSCNLVRGIAEFKCPYTKLDVTPEEACETVFAVH